MAFTNTHTHTYAQNKTKKCKNCINNTKLNENIRVSVSMWLSGLSPRELGLGHRCYQFLAVIVIESNLQRLHLIYKLRKRESLGDSKLVFNVRLTVLNLVEDGAVARQVQNTYSILG